MSAAGRDVRDDRDGALADERNRHGIGAPAPFAMTDRVGRLRCRDIITPVTTALILAGCAASGVLDVSWVAPTTNVDGSTATNVVTYRVYYSTTDAPCTRGKSIRVAPSQPPAPGQPIVFRLTGLTIGELYYVAVAAVNSGGSESECSITESARARQP